MTQTITISGAGSDLIERLRSGIESNELIDLFGIKFAGVKLSSHIWEGEARGTMIAQEVVVAQPAPWTGDGQPPVGTVCTHMSGIERFRVFAVDGAYAAIASEYTRFWCPVDELRPIKTPAQIAADEREAAIADIKNAISGHAKLSEYQAEKLYDAGLRFPKGGDQ